MKINPIVVLAAINLVVIALYAAHRWRLKEKHRRRQTITIQDMRRSEILTVLTLAALFALTVGVVIAATHQL